jgi:uncharacterized membrane protein YfcA
VPHGPLNGGVSAEDARRVIAVRSQILVFSVLGSLLLLIGLAVFRPGGLVGARDVASDLLQISRGSGADISWSQGPLLFVAGAAAGFLAGMLGMGGGVLKISFLLLLFRMDIFFARAISLVTMFFSSATALWHYYKLRLVNWELAKPMALMAIPGALFGALIGDHIGGTSLTHVFGFFMIFLCFNTLALVFCDPDEHATRDGFEATTEHEGYRCATVGALHGVVSGLLGVSGGVIATPLQQVLLHVPTRQAIANSLLISTVATAVASVVVLWTASGGGDFTLSQVFFVDLFMGSGASLGAALGARVGTRCNVTILRLLFVLLALGAGLSILI